MRFVTVGLAVLVSAVMAMGQGKEPTVTVLAGKTPVLVMTIPGTPDVTQMTEKTVIHTPDMFLHVWVVAGATNVADAVSRLADVIKGDVLDFKPAAVTDVSVAGAPAKQLVGPGKEADDGDPGHAEAVVFTAGGRVFVACVHGEDEIDSREQAVMGAALRTAKAP